MARFHKALGLSAALVLASIAMSASSFPAGGAEDGKFVGVGKCKMCHCASAVGKQYDHWVKSKHAKTWEALASEEAKKIAKEKGIEDPQKDDRCVKCHTAAFGEKEELVEKTFDKTQGVQCEACHGPGAKHVDARVKDEDKVAPGEIVRKPTEATCKKCHNSDGPKFKSFDFKAMWDQIKHPKK